MPDSAIHYKWKEISDLPSDIEQFRDRELESLYQVWLDQRAAVDEKAFAAELGREWSIETGIIEGVYTLERGTTEILIRRGIDSSYIARESTNRNPELVAEIIQAHQDALEGLFDFVAQRRQLSTGYIKELHAALLRHQDVVEAINQFGTKIDIKLKRGQYKEHPNSPTRRDKAVHEYCPPEHVASEMDRMIEFHRQHVQREIPALVEAAWLHHAFTQIHPFQDGNGRVARALASLILIKGGFFPLVVRRDDWERYIDALETADEGDLASLVGLFARLEKRDLTKAIVFAAETRPVKTVDEAVAVTKDVLAGLRKLPASGRVEAERRALQLRGFARDRLAEVARKLERDLGPFTYRFIADLSTLDGAPVATLGIGADHAVSSILIEFGTSSLPGLLFVGAEFRAMDRLPIPLYEDAFRVDYLEPTDELRSRFLEWLDDCIIRGLAEWRKTLV